MKTDDREGRAAGESSAYRLACPGNSDCVALRDCPQILVEATTRCYNSDRSMFCGVNQNYEPYVCCPSPSYVADASNNFNAHDKLAGPCGKSLIQGSFYKKLGAYPFVARVGFKSEFMTCKLYVRLHDFKTQIYIEARSRISHEKSSKCQNSEPGHDDNLLFTLFSCRYLCDNN